MKPTVGRTVMYTNLKFPPEAQAAVITTARTVPDVVAVDDMVGDESFYWVTLAVFYRTGLFFMVEPVPYSPEPPGTDAARGKWGWPPRV